MHKSFGSLLSSLLVVFEKYGYKEFSSEAGEKVSTSKHAVMEVDPDADPGIIVRSLRPGIADTPADGSDMGAILRKEQVVVGGVPVAEEKEEKEQEQEQEQEQEGDEDEIP